MDVISLIIAIFAGLIAIAALIMSLINATNAGQAGPTGPPGPAGAPGKDGTNGKDCTPQCPGGYTGGCVPIEQGPGPWPAPGPFGPSNPTINLSGISPDNPYRLLPLQGRNVNLAGQVNGNPAIVIPYDSQLQPGSSFTISTKQISGGVGIVSPFYVISGTPPNNIIMLSPNQKYIFTYQGENVIIMTTEQTPCNQPNRNGYTTGQWM